MNKQRDLETDEEHLKMVEVGDEFWRRFSQLCNEMIAKAPEGLESYYELYLGEKTSIYGRDTKAIPLKVFTCKGFEGLYPVPTAAVMVAATAANAEEMLREEQTKLKLEEPAINVLEMIELDTTKQNILMLSIGDY